MQEGCVALARPAGLHFVIVGAEGSKAPQKYLQGLKARFKVWLHMVTPNRLPASEPIAQSSFVVFCGATLEVGLEHGNSGSVHRFCPLMGVAFPPCPPRQVSWLGIPTCLPARGPVRGNRRSSDLGMAHSTSAESRKGRLVLLALSRSGNIIVTHLPPILSNETVSSLPWPTDHIFAVFSPQKGTGMHAGSTIVFLLGGSTHFRSLFCSNTKLCCPFPTTL